MIDVKLLFVLGLVLVGWLLVVFFLEGNGV